MTQIEGWVTDKDIKPEPRKYYRIIVCDRCHEVVEATSNSQKYCSSCIPIIQREIKRQWKKDNPEKVRESEKTEAAKARHKRYRQSEKGKATEKRHRQTQGYKDTRERYQTSEKGIAAYNKYLEDRKIKRKAAKAH